MPHLMAFSLPRCIAHGICHKKHHIIAFSDASQYGIGIAIYLYDSDLLQSNLIYAKSKLAPESKSIPRKELIAAHLLAQCTPAITTEIDLPSTNIHYFTDGRHV